MHSISILILPMPQLTDKQRATLIKEHKAGARPKDLQEKYNISKKTFYNNVRKAEQKKSTILKKHVEVKKVNKESSDENSDSSDEEEEKKLVEKKQPARKEESSDSRSESEKEEVKEEVKEEEKEKEKMDPLPKTVEAVDNLVDFELLNAPPQLPKKTEITDFDIMNLIYEPSDASKFDPSHLLRDEPAESKPKGKGFSIKSLLSGKNMGKEEKELSKEEKEKLMEKERLGVVYQIRLYLMTFRDEEHLFSELNLESNDKKINKFIQDLYKKNKHDLVKILDFIKFHVRHNNGNVTGNLLINGFFVVIKVLEVICFKFGLDITGLADDMKKDKDVINCLKEIEIESVASKVQLGVKTDLILKLCIKSVAKYSENKLMKMTKAKDEGQGKIIADKLSSKPLNEVLKINMMISNIVT